MANKSDPYAYCNFSDSTKYLNEAAYWNTYAIFMPIYFVFGFTGRSLSLLAFYRQAKEESAYLFQIFVAIVELYGVVSFTWYTQARYLWSGIAKLGQNWFMKCWFCMFVDAHFHTQGQTMMCSLMLTLCMTLDRIYALTKPVLYNKVQSRKGQQWAIFIFCVFLPFFTALPAGFYFMTTWNEEQGMYNNVYNAPWRTLLLSLLNVQFWLKLIVTLGLVGSSLVLALIYRKRMKKRHKTMTIANKETEEANMRKVRTLFWLTFIQSTLDIIAMGAEFSYNLISWVTQMWPSLGDNDCISVVIAPFTDGARAVTDMADFYIVFALMPSFRQMVIKSVKQTFKIGSNTVALVEVPSSTNPAAVVRTNARNNTHS